MRTHTTDRQAPTRFARRVVYPRIEDPRGERITRTAFFSMTPRQTAIVYVLVLLGFVFLEAPATPGVVIWAGLSAAVMTLAISALWALVRSDSHPMSATDVPGSRLAGMECWFLGKHALCITKPECRTEILPYFKIGLVTVTRTGSGSHGVEICDTAGGFVGRIVPAGDGGLTAAETLALELRVKSNAALLGRAY